jgi:hypothetical protein
MHHSLNNRFRGAFLGAVLAEALCPLERFQPVDSPGGKLAIRQARSLIHTHQATPIHSLELLPILPIALFYHEDLPLLKTQIQAVVPAENIDRAWKAAAAIAQALRPAAEGCPDFRHTVFQAMCRDEAQRAIVGAVAGAAQSVTGIPPGWRKRLTKAGYAPFWGLAEAQMIQMADQLLAAWAGVYHPTPGHLPVAMPRPWRQSTRQV